MINPVDFAKILKKNIKLIVGVPDSLLKHAIYQFEREFKKKTHNLN